MARSPLPGLNGMADGLVPRLVFVSALALLAWGGVWQALGPPAGSRQVRLPGLTAEAAGDGDTLIVTSVGNGSPAAAAQVRAGDAVVAIDRHPFHSGPEAAALARQAKGDTLFLDVQEGSRLRRVELPRETADHASQAASGGG